MTQEPKPAFGSGTPAAAPGRTDEPRPAFGADSPARATPPRQPSEPAPTFAAQATARPAVLAAADEALRDEGPEVARRVKALVVALDAIPQDDFAQMEEFGRGVQALVDQVSRRTLDLARTPPRGFLEHLAVIREQVTSIGAADLLDTSVASALMRRLVPPRERLAAALQKVGEQRQAAEQALPDLDRYRRDVEAVARAEEASRSALQDHIRAADIILKAKRAAGAPAHHLDSLEARLDSLRTTVLVGANDAAQIDAQRAHAKRLAESGREVLTNLVGAWQRQCASAMTLLEARRADDLTARDRAASTLGGARSDLAAAIDRILQPQT